MGEYADQMIAGYLSGRRGIPIGKGREYEKVSRSAIAHQRFKVVTVIGGRTNRMPGTKLVVTEKDETTYHVWASNAVTGIAKAVCQTLKEDMSLNEALGYLGRKLYNLKGHDAEA